jgi:ATP-binding protein involved in chromosome partitioning
VPTPEDVLRVLSEIVDPDLGKDVVSLGMIKDIAISPEGGVAFTFELTTPACPVKDRFESLARDLVGALPGVKSVEVKMTSHVRATFAQRQNLLPGVKQVIAVASGKGGVGKSTVSVNLAAALRATGAEVGLLDADIYGPTIPGLLGTNEEPRVIDGKLQPLQAYGLRVLSFGMIAGSETALIWRGPMVSKAISQLFGDVDWGELDYLVVDLPPGTGDASLTVAQAVPLTGVVVVCTPQSVALNIAVKALQMFQRLNVKPLGLVENMSYYVCPDCGHEAHIFDHGGAEKAAVRLSVPFLGSIPLEEAVREESDAGSPVVLSRPDSAGAKAFAEVAAKVAAQCSIQSFRQLPVLNVR